MGRGGGGVGKGREKDWINKTRNFQPKTHSIRKMKREKKKKEKKKNPERGKKTPT